MSAELPPDPANAAADRELEQLLDAGRAVAPDAARVAKLGAGLGVGAAPAAKASLALPIALVASIAIVGALWWMNDAHDGSTSRDASPAPAPTIAAPTEPPRGPSTSVVEPPVAPVVTPAPTSLVPPVASTSVRDRPRGVPQPAAPAVDVIAVAPPVIDVPSVEPPAPVAPPRPTEASFLVPARASLARTPARALSLCDAHAGLYPAGILTEERELIATEALVNLGRIAEARARAGAFRRAHPGSAYLERIDRALASDVTTSDPTR